MTQSNPQTEAGRGAQAVLTNGEGKKTTAHLNLTRTMAEQVAAEVADKSKYNHTQSGASHV